MRARKILTIVEETHADTGKRVEPPTRKAAAVAVIENPAVGDFKEDLSQLFGLGEELGSVLGRRAVQALGIDPVDVESYGKAAVVGQSGELEHAAAILHPKLGAALRAEVGGGKAIIPSTKKVGGPGTSMDVPLYYKKAAFVVSHIDSMEIRVPDAPRDDEIVVAIAVTDSGRPFARVGGLRKEDAKGEDGLR